MPKRSKNSSFNKILKLVSWNLFAVGLVLIAAEGLCRLLKYPYNTRVDSSESAVAQFDPTLGWVYKPNFSKNIRIADKEIKIHFDSNGIRVPHPDYKLDSQKPSALFIGDSYTMGHGLAFEDSFVGNIAGDSSIPLQVVNLGVQAYGTDQSYLALKKFISQFNTKLVIYTFLDFHTKRNGNYDRRMLFTHARFIGTKPLFAINNENKLILKKKPLLYDEYSHSWLWDAVKMKLGSQFGTFPPYPVDLTKQLIKHMDKICKENNAEFVVLYWNTQPDPLKIFDDLDVKKIDLDKNVPTGFHDLLIPRDFHPNAEAHRIVADIITKKLELTTRFHP